MGCDACCDAPWEGFSKEIVCGNVRSRILPGEKCQGKCSGEFFFHGEMSEGNSLCLISVSDLNGSFYKLIFNDNSSLN